MCIRIDTNAWNGFMPTSTHRLPSSMLQVLMASSPGRARRSTRACCLRYCRRELSSRSRKSKGRLAGCLAILPCFSQFRALPPRAFDWLCLTWNLMIFGNLGWERQVRDVPSLAINQQKHGELTWISYEHMWLKHVWINNILVCGIYMDLHGLTIKIWGVNHQLALTPNHGVVTVTTQSVGLPVRREFNYQNLSPNIGRLTTKTVVNMWV